MGGTFDTKALHERLNQLEHLVRVAETKSAAATANEQSLRDALEDAQRLRAEAEGERDAAERWLAGLQASASWRLTSPLRAAKRATLSGRDDRDQDSS